MQVHQNSIVPESFSALVRKVIADMFLAKGKVTVENLSLSNYISSELYRVFTISQSYLYYC